MFIWLKNLLKRKVEFAIVKPFVKFEMNLMRENTEGMYHVWEMNKEIDDISENIQELMKQRQDMVADRANLVESLNKHRQAFGYDLLNDEGVCESDESADDETYALES